LLLVKDLLKEILTIGKFIIAAENCKRYLWTEEGGVGREICWAA